MATVLIVDDDRSVRHLVTQAFRESPITVLSAEDAREGLALAQQGVDLVLLDIRLPDMSGLDAVGGFRAIDAKVPIILITGQGSSETAIEAMKLGAYDHLLKPLDLGNLKGLVQQALNSRRMMSVPVKVFSDEATSSADQIVGSGPAMQSVFKAVGRAAPQNITVLITGESGTGKELVARAIYQHSRRSDRSFLAVNCAAIPDALLESELFGHERGSFTGADQRRIGKFEQYSGGTIFLDEVGDMSPLVQSKVLRLLQEQRFERVGGTQTIQTDVRIITATNRDLKKMATEGTFREDLFYRLSGFTIKLPPLRERGEDVLLLVQYYIRRLSRELNKEVGGIAPEALDMLLNYRWPGNVRELEAVVRQSLLQANGPVILPEFLPDVIRHEAHANNGFAGGDDVAESLDDFLDARLRHDDTDDLYAESLEVMERVLLTRVLNFTKGNQSHAARLLGMSRGTLRTKIRMRRIALRTNIDVDDEFDEPIPSSPR